MPTDHLDDRSISEDVAQREVQASLRVARHEAEYTPFDVADELDWPLSRVLKSEQSAFTVQKSDLDVLLDLYRAGDELRQRLTFLTRILRG